MTTEHEIKSYLESAKKAMDSIVSDSAEAAAEREKRLRELKKHVFPAVRQYHVDLFLEGYKLRAVIDLLTELDKNEMDDQSEKR